MRVRESKPGDGLWPQIAKLFPRAVAWMNGPDDEGDYHFLAATDDTGTFLGASVIDIGPLGFGPLKDVLAGFLEDIEVLGPHHRKGVGKALLRATLEFAWQRGAESVRWTADYDNTAALALYRSLGCVFVPEEYPAAPKPERYYTVVAVNPAPSRPAPSTPRARET